MLAMVCNVMQTWLTFHALEGLDVCQIAHVVAHLLDTWLRSPSRCCHLEPATANNR